MTLQLHRSGFPYILGKLNFLFYQCIIPLPKGSNPLVLMQKVYQFVILNGGGKETLSQLSLTMNVVLQWLMEI
jgi:hypothetical protein